MSGPAGSIIKPGIHKAAYVRDHGLPADGSTIEPENYNAAGVRDHDAAAASGPGGNFILELYTLK